MEKQNQKYLDLDFAKKPVVNEINFNFPKKTIIDQSDFNFAPKKPDTISDYPYKQVIYEYLRYYGKAVDKSTE
jgi:hypothetical protein